jgi:hypothetical protein
MRYFRRKLESEQTGYRVSDGLRKTENANAVVHTLERKMGGN